MDKEQVTKLPPILNATQAAGDTYDTAPASWARLDQLTDAITEATTKFIVLDKNDLSGSFRLMGSEAYQVGWGSKAQSDASGNFTPPVQLSVSVESQEITKLLVIGHDKLKQWPTLYDIELLNGTTLAGQWKGITQDGVEKVISISPTIATEIRFTFHKNNVPGTTLKLIQAFTDFRQYAYVETVLSITDLESIEAETSQNVEAGLWVNETDLIEMTGTNTISSTISLEESEKVDTNFTESDTLDVTSSSDMEFTMPAKDYTPVYMQERDTNSNIHSELKKHVRTVYAKVRIKYTEDELSEATLISSNVRPSYNCNLQNLINGYRHANHKYLFSNEMDEFGTYQDNMYHPLGYGSPDSPVSFPIKADGEGVLEQPLVVFVTFPAQGLHNLLLAGDLMTNNYPVDFVVDLMDVNDRILHTEEIVGNKEVEWVKRIDVYGVAKLQYTITKISQPWKYPKLQEIFGAIVEEYERDNIVNINILEELRPESSTIDLGTISANQAEIQLINTDQRFGLLNSQSNLYNLLKSNREITVFFGVEIEDQIEWVQVGRFYSGPWKTKYGDITTSIVANDRLTQLNGIHLLELQTDTDMRSLIIAILTDAGLTPSEMDVDAELSKIKIPKAALKYGTQIEVLADLLKAVAADVYCDRNGAVVVRKRQSVTPPQVTYEVGDIYDYLNLFDQREIANDVTITYAPMEESNVVAVINDTTRYEVAPKETRVVNILNESHELCYDYRQIEFQWDGLVQYKYKTTSWGLQVTFTNTQNATSALIGVKANGRILKRSEVPSSVNVSIQSSITRVGRRSWKTEHALIQTAEAAKQLAEDVLSYYSDYRPILQVDCRGDFAVDLGHDVMAQKYDNLYEYALYRQISARHQWDGSYRAEVMLEYQGGTQ